MGAWGFKKGKSILKAIKCDLSRELKNIIIYPLSDMHIGDECADLLLLKHRVAEIAETPNAYCILNGDLINMATRASISDIYGEVMPPMEQLERCVDMFSPIKDKILCITSGNHEERSYKSDGIDITALMASQLGIRDRYTNTTALLFIRFGQMSRGKKESNGSGQIRPICYTLYATHGGGGGRKEGGKINRLADLAGIVDADIYIHSHTHLPLIFKGGYYRTDLRNSKACYVDKLFVNTAAHLNYGGYGDRAGFKPASKDTPTIYLDGTVKRMTATL